MLVACTPVEGLKVLEAVVGGRVGISDSRLAFSRLGYMARYLGAKPKAESRL